MKKTLSVALALAMMITALFSVMVIPASLEIATVSAAADPYNFMQESYIAENPQNVTVNADGTWTVTGNFALAPNVTFDYTDYQYIIQNFETDTEVEIVLLDRDPNGVYEDHWIGLYSNWNGATYYPVGTYNSIDSLKGIFDWNIANSGWGNTNNTATCRAIYVNFNGGSGNMTLKALGLSQSSTTTEATTTTTAAPAPADPVDMLVEENIFNKQNLTVEMQSDGSWLVEATAAGSLAIAGPGSYDASVLTHTHIAITSDVPFVVAFYDDANSKWMTSSGDFSPQFATTEGQPAPAGAYALSLWTNGCYTWDGSALPATVTMHSVYIEPQEAGKMVISHLYLADESACTEATPSLPTTTTTTTTTTTEPTTTTTTAFSGIYEADGVLYYVDYTGVVKGGKHYITTGGEAYGVTEGYIFTDETGRLYDNEMATVDGTSYYFVKGKPAADCGVIQIDGDLYYVSWEGIIQTGKIWIAVGNGLVAEGTWAYADETGRFYNNEFATFDGNIYYLENGQLCDERGVVDIDGSLYYIYWDGTVATSNDVFHNNFVWVIVTNGLVESDWYQVDPTTGAFV